MKKDLLEKSVENKAPNDKIFKASKRSIPRSYLCLFCRSEEEMILIHFSGNIIKNRISENKIDNIKLSEIWKYLSKYSDLSLYVYLYDTFTKIEKKSFQNSKDVKNFIHFHSKLHGFIGSFAAHLANESNIFTNDAICSKIDENPMKKNLNLSYNMSIMSNNSIKEYTLLAFGILSWLRSFYEIKLRKNVISCIVSKNGYIIVYGGNKDGVILSSKMQYIIAKNDNLLIEIQDVIGNMAKYIMSFIKCSQDDIFCIVLSDIPDLKIMAFDKQKVMCDSIFHTEYFDKTYAKEDIISYILKNIVKFKPNILLWNQFISKKKTIFLTEKFFNFFGILIIIIGLTSYFSASVIKKISFNKEIEIQKNKIDQLNKKMQDVTKNDQINDYFTYRKVYNLMKIEDIFNNKKNWFKNFNNAISFASKMDFFYISEYSFLCENNCLKNNDSHFILIKGSIVNKSGYMIDLKRRSDFIKSYIQKNVGKVYNIFIPTMEDLNNKERKFFKKDIIFILYTKNIPQEELDGVIEKYVTPKEKEKTDEQYENKS